MPLHLHRHQRGTGEHGRSKGLFFRPEDFTRSNRHPLRTQTGESVLQKRT